MKTGATPAGGTKSGPRVSDAEREVWRPVREILRPKARLSIAEWARLHIKITEGPMVGQSGEPVRWSPDAFPPQKNIMDAIDDNRWSKIFIIGPPQASGKTQCAALPPLLHAIQHLRVSAVYVGANLNLATTQWVKKIRPAIEADAEMKRLLFNNPDDGGTRVHRRFTNGTSLHCAGADSVGALSGFTASKIICDDVQAYPATLPGFGHPVDLAFMRADSFPKDQITLVGIGTAGTVDDYLWRSIMGSAFFVPLVPCLGCGTYQMLTWDRLVFNDSSPQAAEADTWMRCINEGTRDRGNKGSRKSGLDPLIPFSPDPSSCDHRMTFEELPAMLRAHKWVSTPPGQDWVTRGREQGNEGTREQGKQSRSHDPLIPYPYTERATDVAGFWLNALYWTLGKSWGERAAEWLGRVGNPDKEKDHQQNVRVIPWQEPEEDLHALTIDAIAEHKFEGHRYQTVPEVADLVTLTADVHDTFIYYIVRAWRKADGSSWLVDAGTLGVHGPSKDEKLGEREQKARVGHAIREALDDLWKMEAEGWEVAEKSRNVETSKSRNEDTEKQRTVRINAVLCMIDGGYRPDAVGQFCLARRQELRRRKWVMIKGESDGDIWAGKVVQNKRGHPFYRTNVSEGKHVLRELLAVGRNEPGAWHTYADRDLEAYHRHLISEHFITVRRANRDKKIWEKREGGGPNHWLDCEVYQIPAAIVCKIPLPAERFKPKKQSVRPIRPAMTTPDGRPFVAMRPS